MLQVEIKYCIIGQNPEDELQLRTVVSRLESRTTSHIIYSLIKKFLETYSNLYTFTNWLSS